MDIAVEEYERLAVGPDATGRAVRPGAQTTKK
jgi:hypothetical protein